MNNNEATSLLKTVSVFVQVQVACGRVCVYVCVGVPVSVSVSLCVSHASDSSENINFNVIITELMECLRKYFKLLHSNWACQLTYAWHWT